MSEGFEIIVLMSFPSVSFSSVFLCLVVGRGDRKGQIPLLGGQRLKDGRVSGLDLLPQISVSPDLMRPGFPQEERAGTCVRCSGGCRDHTPSA